MARETGYISAKDPVDLVGGRVVSDDQKDVDVEQKRALPSLAPPRKGWRPPSAACSVRRGAPETWRL